MRSFRTDTSAVEAFADDYAYLIAGAARELKKSCLRWLCSAASVDELRQAVIVNGLRACRDISGGYAQQHLSMAWDKL